MYQIVLNNKKSLNVRELREITGVRGGVVGVRSPDSHCTLILSVSFTRDVDRIYLGNCQLGPETQPDCLPALQMFTF